LHYRCHQSRARSPRSIAVLKQYGGVDTPLEPKQLYTNEFVPTGAEFVPPQNKT